MAARTDRLRLRALALPCALAVACATNPVTGDRELILMSPEEEVSVGRQAAQQVQQEIGLVRDPALTALVEQVGARVAQYSPRTEVEYRFAVADMEEPNAFALPGGWIYVSRGLLVLTNTEDELANVIAHEIGHVAARHAAQRQTRSLGAGILTGILALGGAAVGGASGAQLGAGLGQVAGAGLIASYSRDQERQADDVGQEMAARAGYDPAGMARFLESLEREGRLRAEGQERRPSFFDSHPMTGERVENARARAQQLVGATGRSSVAPSRTAYLQRLDGLLVGPDPGEGVFRDSRFLHPGLRFELEFPRGWETQNARNAVAAQAPGGEALLILQAQGPAQDPGVAAARWSRETGVAFEDARRADIGGLDAFRAVATARSSQGPVLLDLTWFGHPRGTLLLTGVTSPERYRALAPTFYATARSFQPLDERELAGLEELRLEVVAAREGETLAALSRRVGNAWSLTETSVVNALPEDAALRGGAPVKVARRVPYRSR